MTNFRTLALLLPLFLFGACGGEAGASANVTSVANSLTKVLSGITDQKSAEAAKPELTDLTDKLSGALESMKSAAGSAGSEAKNKLGELAKNAAGNLPDLSSAFGGIKTQIERLMGNAEIVKSIGPILAKLKGLIPGQ